MRHFGWFSNTMIWAKIFEFLRPNQHHLSKNLKPFFRKSIWIFTPKSTFFFYYSIYNLRTEEEARVTSLGRRSFIFWLTAVLCWINDRLYCEIWSSIGFPYLHGFWHVLIFLAAYTAVVLFAYFDVKQNHPHETPLIQYWPIDSFELGIPYCQLKSYHLNKKEHHIWKVSKKKKFEHHQPNPKLLSVPPSPILHINIS